MIQLKQAGFDAAPARAAAARLAQRTSLAVSADRIDQLTAMAERSWDEAVESIMNQAASDERPAVDNGAEGGSEWTTPIWWWVDQMSGPDSDLTDRMAWFWHGLLTTNAEKVSTVGLLADQLHLLRTLGRTDYRTLLHAFVTSGALQEYLDGSNSRASNPNENLARELMELFTVGRTATDQSSSGAQYDEADVKAAARALSGWVVEDGKVEFRRENAFIAPLIFMGEQANWDTAMVVDRLCDHPATAVRVAGRLWLHLVGTDLPAQDRQRLGQWWADNDLAIDPLVERILTSPAFLEAGNVRARSSLEWFTAARSATGAGPETNWVLWTVGQMPYQPPNVAGWQDYEGANAHGQRWLAAGSLLSRVSTVWSILDDAGILNENMADHFPVETDEVLARCGIVQPSKSTSEALEAVGQWGLPDSQAGQVRWRLALASPEFNLL